MNEDLLLSPPQAARIAQDVYNISDVGISRAMNISGGLGLKDDGAGFQRPAERFEGSTGIIKKSSGFGYVAEGFGRRKGEILVAFRGTMGAKGVSRDWQTNYMINTRRSLTGHKVHSGFQGIFLDYIPDLEAFLKDRRGIVHCVGHSLGGALAALTADYLASKGGRFDVKLYTFGAPRVGLEDFSRNLTKNASVENIHRVFHSTDPVPMIAPYPYIHAPFTGMERLNWGLRIAKGGGRIVPDDHGMEVYLASVREQSSWSSMFASNMEPHTPWEVWLKDAAESKIAGIRQFGANVLERISQCLSGLIAKARGLVGGLVNAGMNAIDQIAWILYTGALNSIKLAWYLEALVKVIFKFLGKVAVEGANLTVAFLRWVLGMLYGTVQGMAQQAFMMLGR